MTRRACLVLAGTVLACQALMAVALALFFPGPDGSVWGMALIGCVPLAVLLLRVFGGSAFQRAPIIGPTIGNCLSLSVAMFISAAAAEGMLPELSRLPVFVAAGIGIAGLYFGSLAGAVLQAGPLHEAER